MARVVSHSLSVAIANGYGDLCAGLRRSPDWDLLATLQDRMIAEERCWMNLGPRCTRSEQAEAEEAQSTMIGHEKSHRGHLVL
jgi:hypothetical protein